MGSGHGREALGLGGDSVATGQARVSVKRCDGFVTGLKEVRRYGLGIACTDRTDSTARQWMYHNKRWAGNGHGGSARQG